MATITATAQMILERLGYTAAQHQANLKDAKKIARSYQIATAAGSDHAARQAANAHQNLINKLGYDPLSI